jgi:hypothetical protein
VYVLAVKYNRSCINFAFTLAFFFYYVARGYTEGDIVMLTDDSSNPMEIPTKENIVCRPITRVGKEVDLD